eukprot:7175879-Pyramimonas_sp.AAC.1
MPVHEVSGLIIVLLDWTKAFDRINFDVFDPGLGVICFARVPAFTYLDEDHHEAIARRNCSGSPVMSSGVATMYTAMTTENQRRARMMCNRTRHDACKLMARDSRMCSVSRSGWIYQKKPSRQR